MSKLVVFPRKSNAKPKAGDSSAAETAAATQLAGGAVLPIATRQKAATGVTLIDLTAELKAGSAYRTLRQERTNARLLGRRNKKAKEAAAAAEKPAKAEGAAEAAE